MKPMLSIFSDKFANFGSFLKLLLICKFFLWRIKPLPPQETLNISKVALNHVGVHVITKKQAQKQGVEPNLNPNRKPEWTVSFWWTRTEPEPPKFYFNEPEPNLNPQNCAQVNPNRTWTPNKSKNIIFHIRMPLALVLAQ